MIKINTIPLQLTDKEKLLPKWKMLKPISDRDLEFYKRYLEKVLEFDIPVIFKADIELTVSVKKDLSYKIDYSKLVSKRQARLIRLYILRDMKAFYEEWMKLV
jgi:hypothetical protein